MSVNQSVHGSSPPYPRNMRASVSSTARWVNTSSHSEPTARATTTWEVRPTGPLEPSCYHSVFCPPMAAAGRDGCRWCQCRPFSDRLPHRATDRHISHQPAHPHGIGRRLRYQDYQAVSNSYCLGISKDETGNLSLFIRALIHVKRMF